MRVRLRVTLPRFVERRRIRARYPAYAAALRIAVLIPGLSFREIRRRTRKCRAVAAPVPILRLVAQAVDAGIIKLPNQAAVIAYTGVNHEELSELERDQFWDVFQAPVFEQLLSVEGQVLAMECDAHDGMHLLDPHAPLTGLRAHLDTSACGCGNWHPRLRRIERLNLPSPPTPLVRPAVSAYIDEHGDDQQQQIHPAGRVA
jgi:hypothetical protein